jgi:hypothetical protein
VTGVAERGSSSVIRYWIQEPSSEEPVKRRPQVANLKKRVLEVVLSTVAVALSLAILAAFWDQKPQWIRLMDSQLERLLQWAWSGRNDGHRDSHVPTYPREFQDSDDSLLNVGFDYGPFDHLEIGLDDGEL